MAKILFKSGEENVKAKLTQSDVEEIRNIIASGEMTQREVGARFGVSQPVISDIVRGKLWNK